MIMVSQVLHNGFYEEFYEFSKNSPFAAIMKFGLWGARLIAALLLVVIPIIPSLPAWAILIICAILTVAQVVMLVMMTMLNDSFNIAAIRRDLNKKHHEHVDHRPMKHSNDEETGHRQPHQSEDQPVVLEQTMPIPIESSTPMQKQPSIQIQKQPSTHMQKQTSMGDMESSHVVIPPSSNPNINPKKLQKQPSDKTFDLSAFINDPTSISSADVQRLFNVYGREKLQEVLLQQAENVVGTDTINTAQNVAKTAQSVATTAQSVATTAQKVATTAGRFTSILS